MMIGTKKQENIMDLKDKLTADADALTARPVAWKDMPPSSFGVDFGATLESDTEPEDGEE